MLEGIRSPMMKEFNLTAEYYDSKDYHGLYHVADTAVSLDFEAELLRGERKRQCRAVRSA